MNLTFEEVKFFPLAFIISNQKSLGDVGLVLGELSAQIFWRVGERSPVQGTNQGMAQRPVESKIPPVAAHSHLAYQERTAIQVLLPMKELLSQCW